MPVKKLTPLLFVEKIESVLPFWTQHLGFIKAVAVPDGDKLAFVILQQGTAEVMYQSFASVDKDVPAIAADIRKGPTFLYLEVDDLEAVKAATAGMDVYCPRTHYFLWLPRNRHQRSRRPLRHLRVLRKTAVTTF